MSNFWILRILNGEHAGAEVSLNQTMTLGSDEEKSDLVLGDDFVLPCFFMLVPDETGIKVMLIDQSLEEDSSEILEDGNEKKIDIQIDGHSLNQDEHALTNKVIFVGDLAIALRAEEHTWSDDILAFSSRAVNPGIPDNEMQNEKNTTQEKPAVDGIRRILNVNSIFKFTPLKIACIGGGLLALVALYSVGVNYPADSSVNAQADNGNQILGRGPNLTGGNNSNVLMLEKPSINSRLNDLLAHQDYLNIVLSPVDTSDHVYVTGYVDNDVTLVHFNQQLNELNVPHSTTVYSMEQIKRSARLILANLGLVAEEIKYQSEPGYFTAVIDGDYMEDWENAQSLLLADIPGLQAWDLEVEQRLTPLDRLKQLAEKHSIAKQLSYVEEVNKIKIIARVNAAQRQELVTLMDEFRTRVGELPQLEHITPTLPNRSLTLNDFGIAAVRSGKSPYVTYENGKRYLAGARLPNGIRIQSFSQGEVTILRGNNTFVIRYEKNTASDTAIDEKSIAYHDLYGQKGTQK